MLIYSIPDSKPLIYTGSSWETLCTSNINSITAQEYFIVKSGIPFLPAFSTPPGGVLTSGTIYYSTLNKALMVYNGSGWTMMVNMVTGTIAPSSGFIAGVGVKTVKLPVLNSNPSPTGLVSGAFYINSVNKIIRYYDGSQWQDISCQAIVQTLPITVVTGYSATGGGDVTTNGSSAVTLTGVCWSTSIDPDTTFTTKTRQVTSGLGIGIFSSPIIGLLPLTTYHVRAYALNSQGLVYGQDRTFTTPIAPPTLITLNATGITNITAQSGGDISSDRGASVTSRGIIYSSVSDPLTDFLHAVTTDGSGVGYFISPLNGLLGNTMYYVRSYAVNSVGTAYGNLVQFTTSAAVPPVLDPTLTIYSIKGSSATGTAIIENNGGALVTERGVCFSTDKVNYTYIPSSTVTPTDIGTFITTLTGLSQGITYYVKGYATNSAGTGYTSETSFTTATLAHITTTAPSGVAGTTANSGGNVLDSGYSVITSRGICWDTLPDPTINLLTKMAETITGDGTGTFTSGMTGLTAGKTYYVRAYVINTAGVAYGQQEQFTMPDFAKVVTLAASSLFNTTATAGGNVLSDGGSPITERGVCWSTLPAPTYDGLQTSDGDGLGIYMSVLTGLTPRSVYHYRAYAKNAVGISYGDDRTLTIDPDAPTIITLDITGISSIVATSGGKITNNGGAPITRRGIIWSTKGDPVDDPDQFITNDGSGVGEFPSDMKHLLGTTTYYVRAYAVNVYGTAYGNLLFFTTLPPILPALNPPTFSNTVNTASTATFLILHNGGAPITDRGICYYTTDSTNKTCVSSTTVNPLDIGTFLMNLLNLVPGTTYYVKSYATNAVGTAYSTESSFKSTSLPIVTTTEPNQIQGRSVYSGGTVFYVGDMNLQAHGVVWSTSSNPTIDLDTKTSETVTGVGTGVYTSYLSGLTPNTTYYVRAYAINSDGVGYGENLSFLAADYPLLVTTTPHSMTTNYAVLGGEIYSDGNSAVTERGVCYSTSPSPTYSDSHVADPEAAGIGTFVIQPFKNGNMIVGGLRENTKFYVRAYAVNSAGVAYGNLDSMMMQSSQLIAYGASSITITSFTMSGTVNSSGYKDIGTKGFVWSTTNVNPTVSDASSYDGFWAGGIGRNIFNLPTDTKYYYRVYAYTSNGLKYSGADSVSTLPSLLATLTTAHPSAMASSSAVSGGTISFNGNTAVTERGVCWSISPNPTLSGNHTATGSGTGTFVTNMTNLLGSTKYYVRAYALNTAGEGYGNLDSLVTAPPVLPVVNTTDAINIGSVKAVGRGNVIDAGGATVSETGVCWNLTGDPTVADNYVKAGSGVGNFSATMTGLTPVTRYYMRAYAVNKVGMAYGDVISFSTFTLATIVTSPVSEITNVTATSGGQISSDGGTPVTTSGICWNTTGVPTIDDSHTTGNIGIGSFIHSMTELMGSVTYYVRAYATNEAGTAYGQVQSFTTEPPVIPTLTAIPATNGGDGLHVNGGGKIISNGGGLITTEGLVWSTSSSFVPDTVVINRSTIAGSGNFTAIANRLQPGMTYYIRAYATNSTGTGYSDNVVSITTYYYPTVTTVVPDLSSVTSMSVQTGGNITSDGGTEVTENGLCWSVVSPPTISDSVLVNGVGTVSFIRSLTNMFGNTTYYVRAYAKNSVGVAYGQVETFTTLPPELATITTLPSHPTSSTIASGGGNITTNGGALVTTRGLVWSNTPTFIPDTVVVNRTATTGYYVGSFTSLMTGLQTGTKYYVRAYVENSVGVTYGELASFSTPNLATVITNYAYPEGPTKGNVGAIITNRGGVLLSARGVVWSTMIGFNPDTVQVNKMSATTSDSIFEMALKNLKGATTYYVMGYATNIAGTTYGNMLSFNTNPAQVATLTTTEATSISWTSIASGGIISDNGGEPITTRGMIWSTTHGFRPDTVVVNKTATTGLDDKKFTSGINGLKVNTTYYARAYVANSIGIAYGNEISFITLSIQTLTASAGSDGYTGTGGGNVIGDSNTAAPITNEGIIWSPAHDPTVALSTKTFLSSGPASTGKFYNEMANLIPATIYYVRAYATTAQGIAYGNEVSFTTPVALPVLTTNLGTPITRSSVYTGGKISTNGNGAITAKGIIWSINANFNPDTVVVNRTMDGTGSANFTSTATGLQLSTSYYIRAYATNSAGTAYGNQVPVSIFPTAPMLNTVDPTAVTGYSATSGGIITMDGGSDVTLKGICWAAHSNPTVDDFKTTNGSGMGAFSQGLTGLQPNTLYYVRSYAVNSIGTGYGSEKTLLTNGIPTLTATYPATDIIATTATAGGKITDDGRSPILTRGIVWSIYSNPTIALSTKTVDDTTRTIGIFVVKMSQLQPNTIYYVRSYATNGVGTGYGSEATFITLQVMLPSLTTIHPYNIDTIKATGGGDIFDNGGMPVTTRGICWSTLPNPTIALLTKINNATGGDSIYTNTIAGLFPGTKYYVRAYAINTKGTGYGNLDSLITHAVRATVSNVVISHITQSASTDSASVVTDGGAPVTARGLCWNTTGAPTIADNIIQKGTGIGSFKDSLTSLVEGPTYYVRAYATNSAGTGYSPVVSTFKICHSSFTVLHVAGLNGAPVTKTVTYGSVSSSLSGKAACWITQNLGADQQATSAADATEASAGWYWQFNRSQGYQFTAALYPATWGAAINEKSDWIPANDPCNLLLGNGWRIPTYVEWTNVMGAPQNWTNSANAYSSVLKLHGGGFLTSGAMNARGNSGEFWASTQISDANGGNLGFNPVLCFMQSFVKSTGGLSLRCLRDSIAITKPSASVVTIAGKSRTTILATAAVTPDGGSSVTNRGFCWNTTGNPGLSDHVAAEGNSTGVFTDSITGLAEGITYYIRAYAVNSAGIAYSSTVTTFKVCAPVFSVQHVEGMNGAPVSKTVVYHSVNSTYSGAARCWITQNLGADQQAASATDATEPSAGWYWQFNRSQGYQYSTVLYPATWIATINETSDWMPANDPCNLLLGNGWRIPTYVEWTNVMGTPQNWTNSANAYSSVLKLHGGGFLTSGAINSRGNSGEYWAATQISAANGGNIGFNTTLCFMQNFVKSTAGLSLRCLRDSLVISKPSVSNVSISNITSTTFDASAAVTPDGGAAVTARGICWNTTGNPVMTDNPVPNGVGTGSFTSTLSGLTEKTYYVRAYAMNSAGTAYSPVVSSYRICPSTFTVMHVAGLNGAPVTKTVTYGSVSSSLTGKAACWITKNLGADQQATSATDATELSAGWYWQFNRSQGYQFTTTLYPATWGAAINEKSDWVSANDPCNLLLGNGWRIPTYVEWTNVMGAPQNWTNSANAYSSILKLHGGGFLTSGAMNSRGNSGEYWASTQISDANGGNIGFNTTLCFMQNFVKSTAGLSIRCLRDSIYLSKPTVSMVSFSNSTSTSVDASTAVILDGGSAVTARGICWNTTGNPVITDNPVPNGTGTGSFTSTLSGLTEGTYYVRAYATNSVGTVFSPITSFKICPAAFTVQHVQGLNGSPVSKTVTYHSISTNISGATKCWLTQNLGADQQAVSATDASEASAGWYWQFNHTQGFKHDGTTRTPASSWNGNISENSNWLPANDPCTLQLGTGWRIPTSVEWTNVISSPQTWTTYADAFASILKLHQAGDLDNGNGALYIRGSIGYYWSSTQASNGSGNNLMINGSSSVAVNNNYKAYGMAIRCICDTVLLSVSDVIIPNATMTASTASVTAQVIADGGSTLISRGVCWNTTGNPTISDHVLATGSGLGSVSEMMTGLMEGPTYYVRAFATNSKGTAYSPHVNGFKICNPFTAIHVAGVNGAPVTKTVTYGTVSSTISGAPRCWITQNLGSDQQATSVSDATEPSAGWYWQFNKLQGYKNDGTTRTPASTWIATISENSDWLPVNDPCVNLLGLGWRLPTFSEWTNVVGSPQYWNTSSDAYASVLKLHLASSLDYNNGTLNPRGSAGYYWSSTQSTAGNGNDIFINSSNSVVNTMYKTYPFPVRCLRDTIVIAVPTVSDVNAPTASMTVNTAVGSASVISNGGATLSARGLCWNTTGNPGIGDNKVTNGSGIGSFSEILTGLVQGPTYYVRGYATNTKGTGYSPDVTSFKICPTTFTLTHTAGVNGAPVTKTITYGSVSSILSGAAKCWLTQNLGADHQASSVTDATEPSAGWYWQFNNPQGYQFTTVRTPATAWTGGISQNSDWLPANDPCRLLLGTGWRLPTYNEWFNADASPRNWQTPADVFASELKLHAAGYLDTGGALNVRGANGYYWSSNQFSNTSYAYFMHFYPGYADATYQNKAFGSSVRCLCDTVVLSVSDVVIPTSIMTATTATGSGVIISDGGFPITSRGLCWNTIGNPVITDQTVSTGVSIGSFTEIIPGLIEGPTYYVRGYATNAKGTAYSPVVSSFKMCNPITIIHTAGINGAPVSKIVTYHSISSTISGAAKCWLTQNLGADQQAASVSDATEPSAGWYWQFNNAQGYQYTSVRMPSTAWTGGISQNSDWLPANDPCTLMLGAGWRLPTNNEWFNADGNPRNWSTPADVFASELKLHAAGYLDTGGALNVRGANGYYWYSNQFSNTSYAYFMHFYPGYADATYQNKAFGSSVRCICDTVIITKPVVSDIVVPAATITVNSAVITASVPSNGRATLTARGVCWNTTGTPTVADTKIVDGSTVTGTFSATMSGLASGTTYYVLAFATNTLGTSYSPDVISFSTTIPMTVVNITPSMGLTVGGTNITITGTSFLGGNDSYTKFLLHGNGSGSTFTDSSPSAKTITAGGTSTQSNVQSVFGGSSAYFDGSGNYLTMPTSSDFDPGISDFSMDAWIYPNVATQKIAQFGNSGTNAAYTLGISNGQITFTAWQLGGQLVSSGSTTVSVNAWSHVALARDGQYFKLYVNGTLAGTSSVYSGAISTGGIYNVIGTGYDSNVGGYGYGGYFKGYIDEFRFSKGVERWKSNFSLPNNEYVQNPTIRFGGSAATNINFVNSTTITANTAANTAGVTDVTVTNYDGQSATLSGGFTYNAPAVSAISPTNGLATGGTNVTITGTNFVGGNDSNTKLLLHADGTGSTFTDSSPGAKAITAGGNAIQSMTLSMFGGSSVYFNGSGDYIALPTSADFDPGTSDFSIDAWIYPNAATQKIAQFGNSGTNAAYTIGINSGQITFTAWQLGGQLVTSGITTVPINAWSHIALARDGQYFKIYINGTLAGTSGATSGAISTGGTNNVIGTGYDSNVGGYGYGGYFKGYIDEFRFSKNVKRWTSNFTPPTNAYAPNPVITIGGNTATNVNFINSNTITADTPANTPGVEDVTVTNYDGQSGTLSGGFTYNGLTVSAITPTSGSTVGGTNITLTGTNFVVDNDTYTKLLIHADGSSSSFTDASLSVKTITANGDATQSAEQSKFGGKSAYFDGSGDYLSIPNSSDWDFSTAVDGTVDFWVNPTALAYNGALLVGQTWNNSDGGTFIYTYIDGRIAVGQNGINEISAPAGSIVTGLWQHVAVVKQGLTTKIYVNGTEKASSNTSVWSSSANNLLVGGSGGSQPSSKTYIDELRVSKGIARWTSSFTLPTLKYSQPTVTIGGIAASNVNYINSTTITATTPVNAAGTTDVTVINYDGQSGTLPGGFTYNAPAVTAISPSSGSTAGGTNVTITGTNFVVDNDAYTKLLLHADGSSSSFTDASLSVKTITANGDATQSAAQSKFGGKSAYFDGSGDYLSIQNSSDWDFSTAVDGTVDFWVNPTVLAYNGALLVGQTWNNSGGGTFIYTYIDGRIAVGQNGINEISAPAGSIVTGLWQHVAVVKQGLTTKIYVNGTEKASSNTAVWSSSANNLLIGGSGGSQPSSNAYIDELRVSKGIARWTSAFTPPLLKYSQPTVTIGGIAASNVNYINSTTITADTPANTVGAKDVTVTNYDGQSGTLSGGFTYN